MGDLRKFLFSDDTTGMHIEQSLTDLAQFSKVTLTGDGGVAIDGGGNLASNFADPVDDTDLVTKGYLNSTPVPANRYQQELTGPKNGTNNTYTTPHKFFPETIRIYRNGNRQELLADFYVAESGGVGTGYDTVIFYAGLEIISDEKIFADYFENA